MDLHEKPHKSGRFFTLYFLYSFADWEKFLIFVMPYISKQFLFAAPEYRILNNRNI